MSRKGGVKGPAGSGVRRLRDIYWLHAILSPIYDRNLSMTATSL